MDTVSTNEVFDMTFLAIVLAGVVLVGIVLGVVLLLSRGKPKKKDLIE